MATSLLLFDLDGCIVDSTTAIASCVDHALARVVGAPPQGADALRWVVGPPLVDSFATLLATAEADHRAEPKAITLARALADVAPDTPRMGS